MTTIAPPKPPQQDELEALIEEARRRARRRRLLYGAAAAVVVAAAALAAGIAWLTSDGANSQLIPPGFTLVQARGPVQHAELEFLKPHGGTLTIDVSTGRAHVTRISEEVWWDSRSGYEKSANRLDGHVNAVITRDACVGPGRRFCIPPSPFDLAKTGFSLPPRKGRAHRVGDGTFRGHRLTWIEAYQHPAPGKLQPSGSQVGYDAVTHVPVLLRTVSQGHVFSLQAVKLLPTLPASRVSFLVPKGGAKRAEDSLTLNEHPASWSAVRAALGVTPLWVGASIRGQRLHAVRLGHIAARANDGSPVGAVPFVRLDYGAFSLQEYGKQRLWHEQPPPQGTVTAGGRYSFAFGGHGIVGNLQSPDGPEVDRSAVLALARALTPAPSR